MLQIREQSPSKKRDRSKSIQKRDGILSPVRDSDQMVLSPLIKSPVRVEKIKINMKGGDQTMSRL